MGLDISCECDQISFRAGSYSGFHWWRSMLAKKLGFDIEEYWLRGHKKTPFGPLLNHSDCDGELTPEECEQMIKPMQDFIRKELEAMENPWNIILGTYDREDQEYFIEKCRDWLEAFKHSAEHKCKLIFC